ncbi:MAG: IMP cyclohydrolase [Dehalococcoidia bacterium]|jgi:IMP cyclohydrolase
MKNPNGPYPGRQIFLGITEKGNPAFAYLVTGRSPASRERRVKPIENGIYNEPIGDQPYDWLRHYPAVKYDNDIGLMTVTNGIQTEAIFETYKLLYHCGTNPTKGYLKKLMDGARYEPDSMKTPRIAGVICNPAGKTAPVYLTSIITGEGTATAWKLQPAHGTLIGISTYSGSMEEPGPFDVGEGLPVVSLDVETPEEIADFIYGISAETNRGEDIRVCAIGGVRSDDLTWQTAIINRHRD